MDLDTKLITKIEQKRVEKRIQRKIKENCMHSKTAQSTNFSNAHEVNNLLTCLQSSKLKAKRETREAIESYCEFPDKEWVKISDLINTAVTIASPFIFQTNTKIKKNYESDAYVYTEKLSLQRIIINLIKNATEAKNLKKRRNITISYKISQKKILIKVSDNGEGIPDNIRNLVFNKGFTTKKDNNLGLGLFVCKQWLEKRLHGKINFITSSSGTVFTITLKEHIILL